MLRRRFVEVAAVAVAGAAALAGGEVSLPLDCFPDAVVRWEPAQPDPEARFGAQNLPGIVLGPPGDSLPTTGSTSVASLGNGGRAVLELRDFWIEDGPGPDFVVFENPFFVGAVPASPEDPYEIFAEPGFVEVSEDGETWYLFPFDAAALEEARGRNIDKDLHRRLVGLAGITPTFTGNWTVPDDPLAWDPGGTGGVSGAGGDAFDLATVGLARARFVRITDANSQNGPAGSAEGFDLDAIVVLHGTPRLALAVDADGDGLSDLAEAQLYGTDPLRADSDLDGADDARELARCRDPNGPAETPFFVPEPRLWLLKQLDGCTELRWTFLGTGKHYDAIRGDLEALSEAGSSVDLGPTDCLARETPAVRWSCDADLPAPGAAFFYLVRESGTAHYGRASSLAPRETATGCP